MKINFITSTRLLLNFIRPFSCFKEKWKERRSLRRIGKNSHVRNSNFAGYNAIGDNTYIMNCKIGIGTYVSHNTRLIGSKIGNYCSIADSVTTGLGHHPLSCVSTHSAFFYDTQRQLGWNLFHKRKAPQYDPYRKVQNSDYSTVIGNDVWIGSHTIILDGITIGTGAVVGAGSVVTKDIPAYAVVAGTPATIIKYRHSEKQIEALLRSHWWENTPDALSTELECDIEGIRFLI